MFDKTTKGQQVTGKGRSTAEAGGKTLSVISKNMHVEGDCETNGQLLIEGKISGNVTAQGIELAAGGSIEGDVIATGEARSDQTFIISGRVTGAVHAAHVQVQPGGNVQGGVVADEAIIHGQVHGGVLARKRLVLEETAEVEGDVHARRLALKEGGQVNGNIHMGDRANLEASGNGPGLVADSGGRLEAKDGVPASAESAK